MDDLQVPPGPGLPRGLTVPARDLVEQFSHASGPGGQGVNTTDSRVQLSFDIGASTALTLEQRDRLFARLSSRLAGTTVTIDAAEYRSQRRNRLAARERLADLLRTHLAPPPPARRPRRRSRATIERRLADKRRRSEIKESRRSPGP